MRLLLAGILVFTSGCAGEPLFKSCKARGGEMVSYTMLNQMCQWPTNDAGKPCTDSKQCEGICGPPPTATIGRHLTMIEGPVVGACSATQLPTKQPNCEAYVENGLMKLAGCFD